MDSNVMELKLRLKQWLPIFEEQAKSGLNKKEWCEQNGIKRAAFFKWQRECRAYLLSKNAAVTAITEPAFVEISCSSNSVRVATADVAYVEGAGQSSSITIKHNGFTFSKCIIATGKSDLRRGIDGLCAVIRLKYNQEPLENDTRKVAPEKWETIIRHPVKKK